MPSPAVAVRLARQQDGIVSRRQLYALGITRSQVRAQLAAGRWHRAGRQSLAVHTGALPERAMWRVALVETGPRAVLDGVTALRAAGLTGVDEPVVHVSVPRGSKSPRVPGVVVHETRRLQEEDVLGSGLRRVRPAVAAVHAALWAASDRQAALFLVTPVQQRLVRPEDVRDALTAVRRHGRRRLLLTVADDVCDGAHALGELDLAAALRRHGLPAPSRQVSVRLPSGRAYLDAEWERWRVALEVDGVQHHAPPTRLADALRDLESTATGRTVVRVPLLALRLDEAAVCAGLGEVLRSRGWDGRPSRRRAA